jgi:hypothetical protein
VTRLAAGNRELLRETVSPRSARVQLLKEQGSYRGARPYYTVAVLKPTGRASAIRHTPFLDRAERLFELFADVTDPARLAMTDRRIEITCRPPSTLEGARAESRVP